MTRRVSLPCVICLCYRELCGRPLCHFLVSALRGGLERSPVTNCVDVCRRLSSARAPGCQLPVPSLSSVVLLPTSSFPYLSSFRSSKSLWPISATGATNWHHKSWNCGTPAKSHRRLSKSISRRRCGLALLFRPATAYHMPNILHA